MAIDGFPDQTCQRVSGQHPHAQFRVGAHDLVLRVGQATGLPKNRVGYGNLAQIVEKASEADASHVCCWQSRVLGQ